MTAQLFVQRLSVCDTQLQLVLTGCARQVTSCGCAEAAVLAIAQPKPLPACRALLACSTSKLLSQLLSSVGLLQTITQPTERLSHT
jgi:hypothetical protein